MENDLRFTRSTARSAEPVPSENVRIRARQSIVKRGVTPGSKMPFPTGRKFIKKFSFLSDRKPDSMKILLDNSLVVLYTG